MESALNTGDTAWMLVASALVLLMIPGLAFFYGGMVRVKSVLNMMMMIMGALFIVGILWMLYGYSMAFGASYGDAGLLGNVTQYFGLEGLMADDPEASVPAMIFVAFQAMFACLTVGLIAGAIADRTKFSAWLVFAALIENWAEPDLGGATDVSEAAELAARGSALDTRTLMHVGRSIQVGVTARRALADHALD